MLSLSDLIPGVHGCPRVAADGGMVVNCGLLWAHDSDCIPYTPGDYLPPPILHPLYLMTLLLNRQCPLCAASISFFHEDLVTPFRGGQANWHRVRTEAQLTFSPCGCVVREIFFERDDDA